MKLIRFGEAGSEKPGIINASGEYVDVSAFGEDFNEAFLENNGLERLAAWLKDNEGSCPKVDAGVRLGPCISRPSKIICIGLNYAKHAQESGMEPPKEPLVFFKSTSAVCGPNDNVIIPKNSTKTDWEVELAIVIGKKASYISKEDARDYIAGYCLHNDYSEREFQLEKGGQWVKGKSNDTFAPLGPFLATKEDIADPHKLRLWLSLNGKVIQDSNTDDMIFDCDEIVSYLSNYMTLLPGDVISTGTPAGVGLGFNPQVFLKAGDVVELGIEGLGVQKQTAEAYSGK
ncbi:fumarylacetoacetate hydrolase family protein [Marinilongibacter aquaticus]|uniref:fumarylacetoacetate hydrolase family protein n=1 Tax=Marinilongibacter aquaticus TaxID=2975157 RepID=UPI0021BCFE1F|nr:fumarylacetoacetate hydrolase family protein [Marinilongibacter aquaticus]UBM57685.1 fumarylacetoacetate hydrolase family protein [Marinilongibacter aquaticus]